MSRWFIECRSAYGAVNTAASIALHLAPRKELGTALVVVEEPFNLMRVTRKQWLLLTRLVERGRSSTMQPKRVKELNAHILRMGKMKLIAQTPAEFPEAGVWFVEPGQLAVIPDDCKTIYLCSKLASDRAENLLLALPDGCVVVDYAENYGSNREGRAA